MLPRASVALAIGALLGVAVAKVLTPPYFNIASKRRIEATATCGQGVDEPELYCKLVGANQDAFHPDNILIQGQVCDECDPSRPDKAHPPQYAIDGSENFWMSPPLSRGSEYNQVNLTISLGQEYHVSYVFIKMGNSPRPGVWALERSADNGLTYKPWQYFADSQAECEIFFGKESLQPITRDDSVICDTSFSKIVPLEGGEMIVSLLRNRPSAQDFFNSTVLQEWTRATNIRLRLMRAKTLLGHLMSVARQDHTVTRRYFYSIKDISVGGRCRCNGHAYQCDIPDENDPFKLLCRCRHNTCGANCERCCDNKVQKPWQQSKDNKVFICEECNCHGHTDQCVYNKTIDELGHSLDIHGNYEGGGVCQNCRDNTEGINCERCKAGFFRPYGRYLNQTDVCEPCDCEGDRFTGNCVEGSGRCECDAPFQEPDCDSCSYGYFGYPNCEPCKCFLNGTDGNYCEPQSGADCPCRPNFAGDYCDRCSEGFYDFPNCLPCDCSPIGSDNDVCDLTSGECDCRINFGGQNCDQCANGYYNFPQCSYCNCDPTGTIEEVCDTATGVCLCREGYGGTRCDQCLPGYWGFPDCRSCDCSDEGSASKVCDQDGRCPCLLHYAGKTCSQCDPGFYSYPKCLSCNCNDYGSEGESCDDEGQCVCKSLFGGKRCEKCREGLFNFPDCEECNCHPAGVMKDFPGCGNQSRPGELCQCKDRVQGRICDQCRPLYWNLQLSNPDGCQDCNCHLPGVISEIKVCNQKEGQCTCKPSVTSRRCDSCMSGTYNLDTSNLFGCSDCGCDIGGSVSQECDTLTGQCYCHPKISGRTCNEPILTYFYPTLHQMKYEAEDSETPTGSQLRYEHSEQVFPGFSSRGFAVFSHVQNHIMQRVFIQKSSLYRLIMRYINPQSEPITADIKIVPENESDEEQVFQVVFKPNDSPSFVDAYGFGSRIVSALIMNPGAWNLHIKVNKPLFLDYFVLMPSAYYEGNILVYDVHKPCGIGNMELCRHFEYPQIILYPRALAPEAYLDQPEERRFYDDYEHLDAIGLKTTIPVLKLDMQPKLNLDVSVPIPGQYVVMLSYLTANDTLPDETIRVTVAGAGVAGPQEAKFSGLPSCRYTWLCHHLLVTLDGEMAVFNITERATFSLFSDRHTPVGIESLTAIPLEEWSLDFIQPKTACIKKEGKCIETTYLTPLDLKKVEIESGNEEWIGATKPANIYNPSTGLVYLTPNSETLEVRGKVPLPGDYIFIIHYYQPLHPNFKVAVNVHDGEIYDAFLPLSHCPLNTGCRATIKQADGNFRYHLSENFQLTFKGLNGDGQEVWLDYVLIVPADKFNERLITEEPIDQSAQFIRECGHNHFYMDSHTSEFCRAAAFSLTTAYNDGPIACQCDALGSLSYECNKFGGQCPCKQNIVGRQCEQCKQGFYGFPDCKPCSCPPTALCEAETGECVCPPRVTGKECEECEPYTFAYDRLSGCEPCNCNPLGVNYGDLQCDLFNGSCNCKDNIVGRTCNRCQSGYYSFPICNRCDCDPRGTTDEICDQDTSVCKCKDNVDGSACDVCKEGTFNLHKSNRKGCTKCFCFGKSETCLSASLYRMQITGVEDWSLVAVNTTKRISVEPISDNTLRMDGNALEVDFSEPELFDKVVYFSAPERFLGNQLKAYGGNLSYTLYCDPVPFSSAVASADVILNGGDTYLVVYSLEQPARAQLFENHIEISESNFFHWPSGQAVNREQLMTTLQKLEAIYIRATYWENNLLTRLENVTLDSASEDYYGDRGLAMSVEKCQCPQNYMGLSCEDCAPGYYRLQAGPFGGFCVPCQCHNHASTCDTNTGVCHDCKHNTMGDHCEKCAEGHHGNATYGTPKDCLICACPLPQTSNNFAHSCEVSEDGEKISCQCKPGYYGARCESCSAGFYGEPEKIGDTCKPCQCSGNINPMESGACDSVSGKCIRCLNNTFGDSCQICAPGYYGDAIDLKNCQSCVCDQCGTDKCEHSSGICQCKDNVQGEKCDRCALHHYGFNSCDGCKPCDCQSASDSLQCEPETGQCRCRPGVTGRTCDHCAPGYWNYTSQGCTLCSCNKDYSIGVGCNPETGQCNCLKNVTGERCDSCPHRWIFIPDEGCEECSTCVHSLLDTVEDLVARFAQVKESFKSVAISYLTEQKLKYINETVNSLRPKVMELELSHIDLQPIIDDFKEVEINMNRLEKNANSLSKSKITNGLEKLSEDTAEAVKRVDDAVDYARRSVLDVITIAESFDKGGFGSPSAEFEQDLQEAKRILDELESAQLTYEPNEIRGKYLNRSRDNLDYMKEYDEPLLVQEQILNELREDIRQLDDSLQDLKQNMDNTTKKTFLIEKMNKKNREAEIAEGFRSITRMNEEVNKLLNETDVLLNETTQLLLNASQREQDLERNKEELNEVRYELTLRMQDRDIELNETGELVGQARAKADQLTEQAEELKILAQGSPNTQDAVEAANAYKKIVEVIREALISANETNELAGETLDQVQGAGENAKNSEKKSREILEEAQGLMKKAEDELRPDLKEGQQILERIADKTNEASADLTTVNKGMQTFEASRETIIDEDKMDEIEQLDEEAMRINADIEHIKDQLPTIAEITTASKKDLNEADTSTRQAHQALDQVNQIKPDLSTLMDKLIDKPEQLKAKLGDVNKGLEEIRKKVDTARAIANSIKLAAKFENNGFVDLRKPASLQAESISSDVSLYLKTKQPNGLVMFLGKEPKSSRLGEYMVLEVENGYPKLTMDLGSGPTSLSSEKPVDDGNWYNIRVKRTSKNVELKVIWQGPLSSTDHRSALSQAVMDGSSLIMDLRSSKLYVGGLPQDFSTTSFQQQANILNYNNFNGTIEELEISGQPIGLWNTLDAEYNTPDFERDQLVSYIVTTGFRFSGEGYIELDSRPYRSDTKFYVSLQVKTKAKEGLIFLAFNGQSYMSIEMREGRIICQFDFGGGLLTLPAYSAMNDGEKHTVEVSRHKKMANLKIDGQIAQTGTIPGTNDGFKLPSSIFFGGYKADHGLDYVTSLNFDGCIDNVRITDTSVDLNKNLNAFGVIPGCPKKVWNVVSFERGSKSYARLEANGTGDKLEIILRFKTAGGEGVLACVEEGGHTATLLLRGGQLEFRSADQSVMTDTARLFNDSEWHVVMARHDQQALRLFVDDTIEKFSSEPLRSGPMRLLHGDIYFGGVPSFVSAPLSILPQFSGCISDAILNDVIINFSDTKQQPDGTLEGAVFGKCILDSKTVPISKPLPSLPPPQEPETKRPPTQRPTTTTTEATTTTKKPEEPIYDNQCKLPMNPRMDTTFRAQQGYRFGIKTGSRIEFDRLPGLYRNSSDFSFDVKTNAVEGVLFFAEQHKNNDFIVVFMRDGNVHFSFDCGSGALYLLSKVRVNDGKWHRIKVRRTATRGSLYVDGELQDEGVSTGSAEMLDVASPYYLGGLPHTTKIWDSARPKLRLQDTPNNFFGCLRAFSGDGSVVEPKKMIDVQPCSDRQEIGIFFPMNAGFIRHKDGFKVTKAMRVSLEIKPRANNGLLVFMHGRKDYLTLELVNGSVVLTVSHSQGSGTESAMSLMDETICDGQWHTVTIVKQGKVMSVGVDDRYGNPALAKSKTILTLMKNLSPFYIGGFGVTNEKQLNASGIQQHQWHELIVAKRHYSGCLRNITFNGNELELNNREVFGNVMFGNCPKD